MPSKKIRSEKTLKKWQVEVTVTAPAHLDRTEVAKCMAHKLSDNYVPDRDDVIAVTGIKVIKGKAISLNEDR